MIELTEQQRKELAGEEPNTDRVLGAGALVAAVDGAVPAGLRAIAAAVAVGAAIDAGLTFVADLLAARRQERNGRRHQQGQAERGRRQHGAVLP